MRIFVRKAARSVILLSLFLNAFAPAHCYAEEYAFLLRARGNPYWKTVALGIEETAKTLGIQATVQMMETETSGEEQLNICNVLIERRPKLLAIVATNVEAGLQCMKRAAERGIAVGDIDASIPLEEAVRHGISLSFSVGSDNFAIGQKAAQFVATSYAKRPLKVFVLEGAPGHVQGRKRIEGFRTKLRELLPDAQIVASLPADWERQKALSTTTDMLQRYPDLRLIYAANDVMALGAVEAVRSAGKSSSVAVIGVDGTADARKAVSEGHLLATVAQLPYLIGKRSVELAARKDSAAFQAEITPTPVLTKDVLLKNSEPLLQYVR